MPIQDPTPREPERRVEFSLNPAVQTAKYAGYAEGKGTADSRISRKERGQPCPRVVNNFARTPRGQGCPRSILNRPWPKKPKRQKPEGHAATRKRGARPSRSLCSASRRTDGAADSIHHFVRQGEC